MQIVVGKILTSYSEIGEGKKVILFLHGWADSGKTFKSLSEQLIKENKSCRAVLLDLPGFGGTQSPSNAWTLEDYVNFVKIFLEKLAVKPEVIIGHSNGGAIAIKGISGGILTPKKLILIGSAGVRSDNSKKKLMRLASKPAKVLIKAAPKTTQEKLKRNLYKTIGSDYMVAEHMKETFKNIVSEDVVSDAALVKIPTCLIYGQNDEATPVSYGEKFHNTIKDSKLSVVPEAGHFVHQEQVYKVSTICTNFIKEKP